MRRSVDANDFRAANGLKKPARNDAYSDEIVFPDGDCWVCESYTRRGGTLVADFAARDLDNWRLFRPLEEEPDLFLRFARMWREADFRGAALVFAKSYGLPCGARDGDARDQIVSLSLKDFARESKRAWVALSLYESVVNRDEEAARALFAKHGEEDPAFSEYRDMQDAKGFGSSNATPLQAALAASASVIGGMARELCAEHGILEFAGNPKPDPSCLKMRWTFENLLGAMYLQMWWVMLSGGDLVRCEHCGRLMSLTRPNPEGRKRRRDKRFCNDACRQAHHRAKKGS